MTERFPHLLAPLDTKRLHLKNRVVFPGHQTLMSEQGVVGERMLGYYVERARGGVGAVIVEGAAVHPTTVKFSDYLLAYDERIVPTLDGLADRLHEYDCRAILQLAHSGSRMSTFDSHRELWAPSAVRAAISPETPHAMTKREIGELLEGYRISVENAARSRVDGIEIHSAHEYLLGEFLSPFNNRRADEYGGSLENRTRLLLEVVDVARQAAGDDFVIGIRINGSDLTYDGLGIDDYVEVCRRVAATGAIDYVNVSAGTSRDNNRIVPTMEWPQGLYVEYAAAIKAAIDVPVFAVGRVKRPEHAEEILAAGKADGIAEARALIADPQWVNKAADAPERIRPCIGCNQGCFGFLYGNHPISCTVNPAVGRERFIGVAATIPRRAPRRVLVVGGGPAGMEAAIAAAEFGHRTTLVEAAAQLGGQAVAAASIPTRRELGEIIDFQVRELRRLGVDVRLETLVDAELVATFEVDDVVVATGSRPVDEPIATDGSIPVLAPVDVMTMAEGELPSGRIAVIDGVGHFPTYAPTERLVDAGRECAVFVPGFVPGANLDQSSQLSTLRRLAGKGVEFVVSRVAAEIRDSVIELRDGLTGRPYSYSCDAVVAAVGNVADDALAAALGGSDATVHVIGDALAPRSMLHAIREGRLLGRRIGVGQEDDAASTSKPTASVRS